MKKWKKTVPTRSAQFWARYRHGPGQWITAVVGVDNDHTPPIIDLRQPGVFHNGPYVTPGGPYVRGNSKIGYKNYPWNDTLPVFEIEFFDEPVIVETTYTPALKDLPK